jgi:hypothetical protein
MVHVQPTLGSKATQVGGLPPETIAKLLLSELVRASAGALGNTRSRPERYRCHHRAALQVSTLAERKVPFTARDPHPHSGTRAAGFLLSGRELCGPLA